LEIGKEAFRQQGIDPTTAEEIIVTQGNECDRTYNSSGSMPNSRSLAANLCDRIVEKSDHLLVGLWIIWKRLPTTIS